MADLSQAAQECKCIDDYFKREAGGTGLLASTQQSSSSLSLASAQQSGGGIPHQRQSQGGGEGRTRRVPSFSPPGPLPTPHFVMFLGHVVVSKPMTDLCETGQRNSASIVRSMNLSEEEKSQVHVRVYIIMTHTPHTPHTDTHTHTHK